MGRVKDNKYGYRTWSDEDIIRFGKFLLFPATAIILIIVILIMDRKNHPDLKEPSTEEITIVQESESETEPESQTEETMPHSFAANEVPEVVDLINRYFTAKQNADAEGIYQLFGWTDLTGIEDLRRQLQYDARYTEGYRNIICYTKPGLTEGTYLVYVSYDLKFKNSLTLAPGFLWNYVKTMEDGTLHLSVDQELSEEERVFVSESEKADEIVLLRTEIYAKLRLALDGDAALAESYGILEKKGGSAGANHEEVPKEVNVQISGQQVSVPDIQTESSGEEYSGEESSLEETESLPEETEGISETDADITLIEPGSGETAESSFADGEHIPESQTVPDSEMTSADYTGENQ